MGWVYPYIPILMKDTQIQIEKNSSFINTGKQWKTVEAETFTLCSILMVIDSKNTLVFHLQLDTCNYILSIVTRNKGIYFRGAIMPRCTALYSLVELID